MKGRKGSGRDDSPIIGFFFFFFIKLRPPFYMEEIKKCRVLKNCPNNFSLFLY
jgi:hypothetical protein